jgi:hypothetical protein
MRAMLVPAVFAVTVTALSLPSTPASAKGLSLSRIVSLLIVGCLLVRAVPVNPGENVGNGRVRRAAACSSARPLC